MYNLCILIYCVLVYHRALCCYTIGNDTDEWLAYWGSFYVNVKNSIFKINLRVGRYLNLNFLAHMQTVRVHVPETRIR